MKLPTPSPTQHRRSLILIEHIKDLIIQHNGWLPFDDYMNAALYTPHLGYYSNELSPFSAFAEQGDFITAPLLTPLFGACLAEQALEIFKHTGTTNILEIGAGTGRLAADIVQHLTSHGVTAQYFILELSAHLRAQQQATLSDAGIHCVTWLNELPQAFVGMILGNEVLDAMPVKLIGIRNGEWFERGVIWDGEQLQYQDKPTDLKLTTDTAWQNALRDSNATYISESQIQQIAFMHSIGACLTQGVVVMIDYGFPAHEFYHPQRNTGTLMCHIQHVAHDNALFCAGVQDITAHVNFSALANIDGLTAIGYTNQANFLINTGILNLLSNSDQQRVHANRVSKLLSEAEMGELFKVMAWQKGLDMEDDVLIGFERGDRLHSL